MEKFNLVFTEHGIEALVTPQDNASADVAAARFSFLRGLADALQQFDAAIKEIQHQ